MKRINIMTSCNNNIAKWILPQLVSIDENLRDYEVHFFLLHNRIDAETVKLLADFSGEHTSINFHEVIVDTNMLLYEEMVVKSGIEKWPYETYFTLRVQDHLPDDVDRVMYIDTGDVIINGDIAPYYFDDFEGFSLIVTPVSFKTDPDTNALIPFSSDDILTVCKNGSLFNSGSYVINVEKFRKEGYTVDDYLYLAEVLSQQGTPGERAFFADQGFLNAAFAGDVKLYGYPENTDPSYMPYNFRTSYWGMFKKETLDYTPIIIHYAIVSKPYVVRFTEEEIVTIIDKQGFVGNLLITPIVPLGKISPQHLRLCEVWWDYARKTPIYDEANFRARGTAESWIQHLFPVCEMYLTAYYHLKYANKDNLQPQPGDVVG